MTGSISDALPWPQSRKQRETAAETTPGGTESTRWVVVAQNLNPGEASVIKGRLDSQNIPAIVQQEAVGSVLGLTVGPLGSANIRVPEPLAEKVLAILAETFDIEDDEDDEYEGDEV